MTSKKKDHSDDLRTPVIRYDQNDDSLSEIATKTLLSRSTVQYIVDKYKSTKWIGHLFERARKRKTRATTDGLIQRKLELHGRKSPSAVKIEIQNGRRISLHVDTIRKRAYEVGLFGRVAPKKPYVNKLNRGKWLKFAKEMLEKPMDVWFDESKFSLFSSDGKVMVWWIPREEFDPKCTIPTVKHSGGSVMVWDYFIRQSVEKLYVKWRKKF